MQGADARKMMMIRSRLDEQTNDEQTMDNVEKRMTPSLGQSIFINTENAIKI